MTRIIRIFFCLCLGVLSGCKISLPTKSQLEHLQAPPNIKQAIDKSLSQRTIFAAGKWPAQQWWLDYQSPELNALISESLTNNPSIQEVYSRITVAQQEAMVMRSILFPLVFFDATETRQYLSKNGLFRAFNPSLPLNATLLDLSLSFSYEFDFWGQNRNLLSEAIGKAKAQKAEAAETKLIITTALSQAYFAYKTNLMRKHLYVKLVNLRTQVAHLHNLLLRKGLSSRLPALTAAENVLEANKLLASINEELSNNQHLINVLAGRGPDSPLTMTSRLPQLPQRLQIPATISLDLIARRPDLMAQIWRAKAWAYKTGAAMSAYYPNVNLVGFIGLESLAWAKFFKIASSTAGLKPAIHLPIFTAGAIRANIRATKAEFDAAIFAYNNLLLRSTQEILDVLVFAQTTYQHNREQDEIVHYAEQRYHLVHLRSQKGLDSQFAVYALQEELIQTELVKIMLLYNQYLASIKLTKALGGGYHQPQVPLVKKI
ncbi:efflux transporter outer membrane subunit [Legionella drancourtii]|uniref:Putative RND efflux system, outer membrane lipoprotein, NodT n=1 Tax=Legionella drancourtii LLAP12 TaxID=658187 RepID=G9ESA6_9GAMM|nr:efflux transporter outer membrane subunit [Legionella drancourtii]EHL29887.1 putative RND efflux system, outer membrane lipoprotein, NodT [Legionella drancourtii LLAP12]